MDSALNQAMNASTDVITTTMINFINESTLPYSSEDISNISTTENVNNTSNMTFYNEHPGAIYVFGAFLITEIIMTAMELVISVVAAIKIPRWGRNHRNQMLMQLSLAKFIKRVILILKFFEEQKSRPPEDVNTTLLYVAQIYIDFVIVILVCFFIKHMYESIIIVVVKINQQSLNKTSICAWTLPVLITSVWTAVLVTKVLDEWFVYLLICCLFRWPLIFLGTSLYITILYQVLSDKIRRFARSLTIVTFLMCLVTNFYLFSKDVIELWCLKSFVTLLASYISGFIMNFLILSFYVILIILNFNHNTHSSKPFRDYSLPEGNKPHDNRVY